MATMGQTVWQMDDIDDALAADFDGSFSGLGTELGINSFNMSETLLALPTIKGGNIAHGHQTASAQQRIKKNRPLQSEEETAPTTIKRFCNDPSQHQPQKHSTSAPDLRHCADNLLLMEPTMGGGQTLSPSSSTNPASCIGGSVQASMFQCVLGAATSIATKVNERTMTYLNQGQSYEIKLKKLGDLTEMQGKLLKSVVRVGFQERRLQYMEKEQMEQWSQVHPQERVLDVDIPLSYGVFDVVTAQNIINAFEFMWDPTKETGVFVRLNCISTEFTPKKHGGEKGVPFRLIVETYSHEGGVIQNQLYSASCQVKVFKPKGADRKHKTDKEKMLKRPMAEQELYQSSFDCTFFTEYNSQQSSYSQPGIADTPHMKMEHQTPTSTTTTITATTSSGPTTSGTAPAAVTSPVFPPSPDQILGSQTPQHPMTIAQRVSLSPSTSVAGSDSDEATLLSSEASTHETAEWLRVNRFTNSLQSLSSFSGSDLLRLDKNDLVTICGVAEGIRLYNLLHAKTIRPALTLYLGSSTEEPFLPIFLEKATAYHLKNAISNTTNNSCDTLFLKGPGGIRISITDDLVRNLNDESAYFLERHDKVTLMISAKDLTGQQQE